MTDLFLRPGLDSQEVIEALPFVEPELAPTVPRETLSERVEDGRKLLQKSPCPICGQIMTTARMGMHTRSKHPESGESVIAAPSTPGTIGSAPEKKKVTRATGPRRLKADDILTLAASGVGSLIGTFASAPTGMAIKLEAPLVGPELDALAAGTIVDKMALQPLMKSKGKFEKVAPLVMLPALVFALDKNPAMLPQLYPMLRLTVSQMLPPLVEGMRRQAAEAEKMKAAAQELASLDPEFAKLFGETDIDPIDALINAIFAVRVPEEEPSTPEEPGSAWAADGT